MQEGLESLLIAVTIVAAIFVLTFIIIKYFYPISAYDRLSSEDKLAHDYLDDLIDAGTAAMDISRVKYGGYNHSSGVPLPGAIFANRRYDFF